MHVDDVVVDAGLILLQDFQESGHIFTRSEELQVCLIVSHGNNHIYDNIKDKDTNWRTLVTTTTSSWNDEQHLRQQWALEMTNTWNKDEHLKRCLVKTRILPQQNLNWTTLRFEAWETVDLILKLRNWIIRKKSQTLNKILFFPFEILTFHLRFLNIFSKNIPFFLGMRICRLYRRSFTCGPFGLPYVKKHYQL